MTIYALVSPTDVIDREMDGSKLDLNAGVKDGWRWLPIEITNPAFDNDTQIRTGPANTVLADRVTRVWTVRDKTAQEILDQLNSRRDSSMQRVDNVEDVLRATILVLLDELNLHAQRTTAILNAVDGAASYGAMRTAIAAIPDVPTRTVAQVRTAIRAKLGL